MAFGVPLNAAHISDNMEVIGAIEELLSKRSSLTIIRYITQFLQNVENWSIEHILKEENVEAGRIAKLAIDIEEDLQLYIALPFDSF
ncbi:hypothetical protein J1N35_009086 [Gossypium stocksii]|uniref:Uncharacterized protein n=1 Tax=Gossypium stocksii TaxID=47602 RepID=A0A9D4AH01_9ROSI|nr:hypothetical protein J1N35_009086 [Gossypium stocksii]